MQIYNRQTRLNAPPSVVFAWHEAPDGFEKLKPSWTKMQVLRHGGIANGAIAELRVSIPVLGVPFIWKLRHEGYIQGQQFIDRQVSGPFKSWKHTHRFLPDVSGGCVLSDEIEFELPVPVPFGATFVKSQLDRLFDYREKVLQREFNQ